MQFAGERRTLRDNGMSFFLLVPWHTLRKSAFETDRFPVRPLRAARPSVAAFADAE